MADETSSPPPSLSKNTISRLAATSLRKMKNASATEPVSVTIDGHAALQDKLTGTEKGHQRCFLHTTVDDRAHFHQVLAWTLKPRWQKKNQLLREVTANFRSDK
jgi:hypothetical protein